MSHQVQSASRYYEWLYSVLAPRLGGRVLEVGPGFGSLAELILKDSRSYVGVDIDEEIIIHLKRKFNGTKSAEFLRLDATDPQSIRLLRELGPDTVLSTHVLEHIENPDRYLKALISAAPGAALVIVVPAFPSLYGRWDREAGHFRRYSWQSLKDLLERVGVADIEIRYFDAVALPALWILSKCLNRPLNAGSSNFSISFFDRLVVPWAKYLDPFFSKVCGVSLVAVGKIQEPPKEYTWNRRHSMNWKEHNTLFQDHPEQGKNASAVVAVKANPPRVGKLSGKKVYVANQISCTSSRVYVKAYEDFIKNNGCDSTPNVREADILLVDTCAVNHLKEEESLTIIKKSEAMAKENAKVIVCGCLAGINPRKLRENFQGDFFSPKSENQLAQILGIDDEESKFLSPLEVRGRFMGADFTAPSRRTRLLIRLCHWAHRVDDKVSLHGLPLIGKFLDCTQAANPKTYAMTISQGCMGNCSFCVIPMAKGETQSVPLARIIEKIRGMVESGVRRITLTSEDTGAYGKDIGTTFVDLLKHIHDIPGPFEVFVSYFDPRWLRMYAKQMLPFLAQGRVRYMQFPLQSGSNPVLNGMRRAYQIEQVLPILREFKKELPRMAMATQIIVGFPGETEEQFEETRRVLKENIFNYVEVYPYSSRPGADSVKLPEQLPQEVMERRARIARKDWIRAKLLPF